MPIPLGIVAVAGAGGGAGGGGSFDLLETTLISSNTASVTFSNLNNYSAYKHLQVRIAARSDRASSVANIGIRFNSDSGSNYATHLLEGTGTAVSTGARTGDSATGRFKIPGNTATANSFGASVIDILDFASSSKNTTTRHLAGMHETSASQYQIILSSGLWVNTAAVTSVFFYELNGNNFVSGSRFSLYGIK
jgi:hypothetical protein